MNELALIKPESLATITTDAPAVFEANRTSCDRCIQAGEALLAELKAKGMSDDLDARIQKYIEKSKATFKKMNSARAPFTKIFDDIRKVFTNYENTIDVSKSGTVPAQLQQARNQYAAQKLAAEEERRRKEQQARQAEEARKKLIRDVEEDYKRQFQNLLGDKELMLNQLDAATKLENYDETYELIKSFSEELPEAWTKRNICPLWVTRPSILLVSSEDAQSIIASCYEELLPKFAEQYSLDIASTKNYILDRLPSKKANLERIAKANAEEAARMKAEMEERARQEAARKEAERRAREDEERKAAELARHQQEMESLFAGGIDVATPVSAKVSKRINLLNPEGIMPILNTWFLREGVNLSVEDLTKIFKKQITFCEKLAKEGTFICDESVEYVDEVKAKWS